MYIKPTITKYLLACLPIALVLTLTACSSGGGSETVYDVVPVTFDIAHSYSGTRVQKVNFTDATATVNLTGLNGNNVILVKENVSDSVAYGFDTGGVVSASLSGELLNLSSGTLPAALSRNAVPQTSNGNSRAVSGVFNGVTRLDYIPASLGPDFSGSGARSAILSASLANVAYVEVAVGDSKYFSVPASNDKSPDWISIQATLRAQNAYCNVWVAEENYDESSLSKKDNHLTTKNAIDLAAKFALIYPMETALLGFENGGGATGDGGVDKDKRIAILIYDVGYDYNATQDTGVLGYFWSKDLYDETTSNNGEMFYLDSYFTDAYSDYIYSTLVHEFQHMINYTRKILEYNAAHPSATRIWSNVATWYNEMLSLVAEDIFDSRIGISEWVMPSYSRMQLYTSTYDLTGVTDWNSSDMLPCYSGAYAFGAYLARNYGGEALIAAMEKSDAVEIASVSEALLARNPVTFASSTNPFEDAFRRYGEALVFSSDGTYSMNTFDKAVDDMPAFDIWDIKNYDAGNYGIDPDYYGPLVWNISQYNLAAYGLTLQSSAAWQEVWGDLSITLEEPTDPDVELYIMIR